MSGHQHEASSVIIRFASSILNLLAQLTVVMGLLTVMA